MVKEEEPYRLVVGDLGVVVVLSCPLEEDSSGLVLVAALGFLKD